MDASGNSHYIRRVDGGVVRTTSVVEAQENYAPSKYRFVILLLYFLGTNINVMMWYVFVPLQTTLSKVYKHELTVINLCTVVISNITYILFNFLANYIIDRFGLRVGFITGSLINSAGLWIRCLCKYNFYWIFAGQFIAGIAQPYFFSTPQKFSNVWFAAKERAFATMFMLTSSNVGIIIGNIIPQKMVSITESDPQIIIEQIQTMMFWTSIVGTVSSFIILLLMREKPLHPPSKAAAVQKYEFKKSVKTFLSDKNAMVMIVCTAIIYGTNINYMSTIQQVVDPYGIDGDEAGYIMSIANSFSIFGAIVVATIISYYRKYNYVVKGLGLLSLIILIGNFFAVETGNAYIFGGAFCLYSTFMGGMAPTSVEYGVELSFPVEEVTVGGLFFMINSLSATLQSIAVDTVLDNYESKLGTQISFMVIIGYQILSTIPLFFVKERLKRQRFEVNDFLSIKNDESERAERSETSVLMD